MIGRIWHGWTTPENADTYETLLRTEIFPGIEAKNLEGLRGLQLFRRETGHGEIEFATIMWFDSLDDVRAFVGDDFETAYVPDAARQVLSRFDPRSLHYDIREHREYPEK